MPDASQIVFIDHPLSDGNPPTWASAWGEDGFGPWVQFRVGDAGQKMRWIPPGRFTMGSPDDEAGRYENEGPQHEVQISEGFWIFDTPCTQQLWQAVMGDNPGRFQSPDRPVEQLSWEDCQQFIAKMSERIPGLPLGLPTEAQWEYACRAGTGTATYAGDLQIPGLNNAPVLDGIAWYGGNCGVEFDLAEGQPTTGWREKQYEFAIGGTRSVAKKRPNAWGLYDMLGNVWEWCFDCKRTYAHESVRDPVGPASAYRVIRGGGWGNSARLVRASDRLAFDPSFRDSDVGFRCSSSGHEPVRNGGGAGAGRRQRSDE